MQRIQTDDFLLTIISPAYNESENLPALHEQLKSTFDSAEVQWEWIVVDDHSTDSTPAALRQLIGRDARVRGVRLSRNFGSHAAIACGLHHARGACAAVLAADLQDPPEVVLTLLAEWRAGAHVVWAVRAAREGEGFSTKLFARLYYAIMRQVVGIKEMPEQGADFFLLDRRVIDSVREFPESNASLLALITWMGFRQAFVEYAKQARLHGRSKWTLDKKLKLAIDSVTSFSYLPIRIMSVAGFMAAVLGFVYAAVVIANVVAGRPVEGWSSLMVVVLTMGGVQMLMLGTLGEYLWRALDESRRRPRYVIEETLSAELDADRHG